MATENCRILIVDDTPAIHEDFRKILTPQKSSSTQLLDQMNAKLLDTDTSGVALPPYEIDSAYQSEEAIQCVRRSIGMRKPYALAFVDIVMPPGDDGITTIARLWKEDPHIQIVICTAYAKYSWQDIFKHFGQTDQLFILKKPFDNLEIIQLASTLTKKWAQQFSRDIKSDQSAPVKEGGDSLKKAIEALANVTENLKKPPK